MYYKSIFSFIFFFYLNINILYADALKFDNEALQDFYEERERQNEVYKEKNKSNKIIINKTQKLDINETQKNKNVKSTNENGSEKLKGLINVSNNNEVEKNARLISNNAYKAYLIGHIEVAEHLYNKSHLLDPKNTSTKLGIAAIYFQKGCFEKAQNIYKEIIEHEPNNFEALNNFLAIMSITEPENAIYEFKRLEAAAPEVSIIPAQIGMSYYKIGEFTKASKYLFKAFKLDLNNNNIKLNLAISLEKAGLKNEAASYYRELIESYNKGEKIPESPDKITMRLAHLNN